VACETTYVFLTFFFKIQKKHDFLRFFEWLTTFSRTLVVTRWSRSTTAPLSSWIGDCLYRRASGQLKMQN